ncbi:MAG TPA: hypothetical protein V6D05_04100 [Stenomitos sp.]
MSRTSVGLVVGTLLIGLMAGCDSPLLRQIVQASPTPSVPPPSAPPITAENLTGQWVYGTTNEPSPGPVAGCYPWSLWILAQSGPTISGGMTTCVGPCGYAHEDFTGTNSVGTVSITAMVYQQPGVPPSTASYSLVFDPRTQHLVGTRNGEPFWAAPFMQKNDCGPAPL